MYKVFFLSMLITCTVRCCDDDPYKEYRVKKASELHPLTQELIKHGLQTCGLHFFEAQQKEAEEKAKVYNSGDMHRDSDGEAAFRYMVPIWHLETRFYAGNKETDPLTKAVFEAVANEQRRGEEYKIKGVIPGPSCYKVLSDGSLRCRTRMDCYACGWAKEYSQKENG